jgi:hypothetical protein
MSSQPNNPAGRLLELINKMRSIPGNIPVREGLAKIFEVDKTDLPRILLGLKDIIELATDAREAVLGLDGHEQSLYLRPIDKVLSALSIMRFDIEWSQIIALFDETTLYGMSICSDVLSRYSVEKPIDEKKIKAMLDDIALIHEDIVKSDLPENLKIFLLEQLEKIRNALIRYRIFGSKYLKTALESATGAVFLQDTGITAWWDHPVIQHVFQLLTQVANIVTVTQGSQVLVSGLQKLLGSGGS